MQLNTYIFFDGSCEEAMTTYAKILGGEMTRLVRYSDMPPGPHTPPGWENKVMHVSLKVGDRILMASDAPPGRGDGKASGFYVSLVVESPEEAERVYGALKDGGEVRMELQETFWAKKFAMIVDRYGTPWMINCDKPT